MQQKRKTDYLDSLKLAQKLNVGVNGSIKDQSVAEKVAKIRGMDLDHSETKCHKSHQK